MTEIEKRVQAELFEMQDLSYREFHSKLMPTVPKEKIIGVRVPLLRKYAKELAKTEDAKAFLEILPHKYYEENTIFRKFCDIPMIFIPSSNGVYKGILPINQNIYIESGIKVDKKHIAASCRVGNLIDGLHAFTAGNVNNFRKFMRVRRNGVIGYLFLKHVQAQFTLYIIFNFINFHIIMI